ncbi:MAG TPA: T9SS type A sorting domain-containing protein, partial [Candidatus Cloacimonas sp.]|nr:T9SS type A sorting domain-containing protein [Candidatus Cloacimonas sp.]
MSKIVIYHDYIYATYRLVYTHDAYNNKLTKTWDYYYDDIWHNWGYTDFSYEQYTANSDDTIPAVTELQLSVYPNPFRENLQISTWAKQSQPAKMEIYNLKGQLVKTYDSFTNL